MERKGKKKGGKKEVIYVSLKSPADEIGDRMRNWVLKGKEEGKPDLTLSRQLVP